MTFSLESSTDIPVRKLLFQFSFTCFGPLDFIFLLFFFLWFDSDAEIVWCQEEPLNMGAFSYLAPRMATAMKALGRGNFHDVKYVGRPPSAATATGFATLHTLEQKQLLTQAFQKEAI